MGFVWAGADRSAGEAVIRRIQDDCAPDLAALDPVRWLGLSSRSFDAALAKGSRAYWRNASFDRLDDALSSNRSSSGVEHPDIRDGR